MTDISINILDNNAAQFLASLGTDADPYRGLDLLFERGRRVVITQQILDELGTGTQIAQKVRAWIAANSSRIEVIRDMPISEADIRRYNPAWDPTNPNSSRGIGDVSIRKYLFERADSNALFEIITNNVKDFDPEYGRGSAAMRSLLEEFQSLDNHIVSRGATGYLRGLILDKAIGVERAKALRDAMGESSRLATIPEEFRGLANVGDDALHLYFEQGFVEGQNLRIYEKAALKGISTRALAVAGRLLTPLAVVVNVLEFEATASQAAILRSDGKMTEANRLWAGFLGQTITSWLGGFAGLFAASGMIRVASQFVSVHPVAKALVTIAGAIAGGVAGAIKGKEFGERLYDENPALFDNYLNPVYAALDALDGGVYDELSTEQFVEKFVKAFGFSEDPNSASAANDLLMAHKWTNLSGLGGDDVLVGWEPEFIARGESTDKTIREAERPEGYYGQFGAAQQIRDVYIARMGRLADLAAAAELDSDPATTAAGIWTTAGLSATTERAVKARQMLLDGGAGDDWVITNFGERAVVVGGTGRDWIFNTSRDGETWGDSRNGLDPVTGNPIEDSDANADNFWFFANTTIKDAQHHDVLKFFGLPLTGGNNNPSFNILGPATALTGGLGLYTFMSPLYFDHFFPHIVYMKVGKDLYIGNVFEQVFGMIAGGLTTKNPFDGTRDTNDPNTPVDETRNLLGFMKIENFDDAGMMWQLNRDGSQVPGRNTLAGSFGLLQSAFNGNTDLGLVFKTANPMFAILALLPPTLLTFAASGGGTLVDEALTLAAAADRFAKAVKWDCKNDPLIIDLDGDGIELLSIEESRAFFDMDGDLFRQRSGWIRGDDGFLVVDANGNGRIDDISEMFGNAVHSGFAELALLDSDQDGKITSSDLIWSNLRIWQDRNEDGQTQAGELKSLSDLGIVSINLAATAFGYVTPQGTELSSQSTVTFASGMVTRAYDAFFEVNGTLTKYAGETGAPAWATSTLNAKGFGSITDLAVAMANDADLGALAATTAAAMTAPNLQVLVQQAGSVLGAWGSALELTRELYAVRVSEDGKTLLERKAWDGAALASGWSLEQGWSPATRGPSAALRDEAPYLTRIVNGRAVVIDYGIKQADGTWKLASDPNTTYASKQAITALAHPAGTEWRIEEIGFNPYAELPVDRIGVRFTDGQVVDYTVQVTDADGTFYVWARNLDRALQLEWKTGDSREFNLRNYAIDFAHLDEVNSSDDSTFRVEMLTPAQFHFATSLGGIDFRPEMLSASLNEATGHLSYAVGPTGSANLSTDPARYVSGINVMIQLLQRLRVRTSGGRPRAVAMEQSRRAAAANDNNCAWREAAFCWMDGAAMGEAA